MKDRKGFTLTELLVVVAIIGILVAISLPIFSNQIERARDAVTVANLRAPYAEAQVFHMSPDNATRPKHSKGFTIYNDDGSTKIACNYKDYGSEVPDVITVYNVVIKGGKRNNWSGLGDDLPFYAALDAGSSAPGGDTGQKGYGMIHFFYDESGKLEKAIMYVNTDKTMKPGWKP